MAQVNIGPLTYEIDEFGNIKKRNGQGYLKIFLDKDGYPRVSVTDKNGKTYNEALHRVQWRAWFGEIPNDMTVDHVDNNKLNSHKDNLQLLSVADNVVKGNASTWIVTDPVGNEFTVYNLAKFARDNNLHRSHLVNHTYKKWKARKL